MTRSKWTDYSQPFGVIGPLMSADDIIAKHAGAGYDVYDEAGKAALQDLATYATDFLSSPHLDLGRSGNVCPYVPDALKKGLLRIAASSVAGIDEIEIAMAGMLDVFKEMAPVKSSEAQSLDWVYKAIIVALPGVPISEVGHKVGQLQKRLKPSYIRAGFMIGEFFPGCPEPGLHNEVFRPLQTPVPALAIRHITKFDAPFMLASQDYLDGYYSIFGDEGRRRVQQVLAKRSVKACPYHSA